MPMDIERLNREARDRWAGQFQNPSRGFGLGYLTPEEIEHYFNLGAKAREEQERRKKEEEERKKAEREAEKRRKEEEEAARKEAERQALREKYGITDKSEEDDRPSLLERFLGPKDGQDGGVLDSILDLGKRVLGTTPAGVGGKLGSSLASVLTEGKSVDEALSNAIRELDVARPAARAVSSALLDAPEMLIRDRMPETHEAIFGEREGFANKASDVIADLAGYAVPGFGAYKAARAIPGIAARAGEGVSTARRMSELAREGATAGAVFSAAQSLTKEALQPDDWDIRDHALNALTNVVLGGALDAASPAIRELYNKITSKLKSGEALTKAEANKLDDWLNRTYPEDEWMERINADDTIHKEVAGVDYYVNKKGVSVRATPDDDLVQMPNVKVTQTGEDTLTVGSNLKFTTKDKAIFHTVNDLHAATIIDRMRNVGTKVKDSWEKQLLQIRRSLGSVRHSIDNELAPALRQAYRNGVKPDELNDYITAVHIKDNMEVARKTKPLRDKLNKEMQEIKEKLASATGREADQLAKRLDEIEQELDILEPWIPPARFQDEEFVNRIVENGKKNKHMVAAQKAYNEFGRKYLKMARDAELISQEVYEKIIKAHPNYVPMQRIVPEEEINVFLKRDMANRGLLGRRTKGSDAEAVNPIEGMIGNAMRLQARSDYNKAMLKIRDMAKDPKTKHLFKKLKRGEGAKHSVGFYENGQYVEYQVPAEVQRMIETFEHEEVTNIFKKAAQLAATAFRRGTTDLNPLFHIRSFVRESQAAFATASANVTPKDMALGLLDAMFGNKLSKFGIKSFRDEYYKAGGKFSGFVYAGSTDPAVIARKIQRHNPILRALDMINPIRAVLALGQISENAPRLALMRALERNGIKGIDAVHEAVDVTNYLRSGHSVRELNRYIPFLNPAIQGVDKQIRAFKKDPAKFLMRVSAYVIAPVVTAKVYNSQFATEEQRSKLRHLQEWERDMFFHIAHPNGRDLIMIPKPYGVIQAFATPVERMIDYLETNDKKVFEGMFKPAISTTAPPHTAAIIAPFVEWFANKDLFTKQDIVPQYMQDFRPLDQVDPLTLRTAVGIAEALNMAGIEISPKKLDNALREAGGTMGEAMLEFIEWGLAELGMLDQKPASPQTPMWDVFNKAFIRDATAGSGVVSELFDLERELLGEKNAERNLLRERMRAMDPLLSSDEITNLLRPETGLYEYDRQAELDALTEGVDQFRDTSELIRNIRLNPDMSREEKRRIIENIRREERRLADELDWMLNFRN